MPTTTTGIFFVARQRPTVIDGSAAVFELTLRVNDNQGAGRVEPYVVRWAGAAARQWWAENQHRIRAGLPLQLVLINPRCFPVRGAGPETHATVHSCQLAPQAPSWLAAAQRQAGAGTTNPHPA